MTAAGLCQSEFGNKFVESTEIYKNELTVNEGLFGRRGYSLENWVRLIVNIVNSGN